MCHIVRHLSIRQARSVCAHAQLCTRSRRRSHATTGHVTSPETVDRPVRRSAARRQMCSRGVVVVMCGVAATRDVAARRYSIGTTSRRLRRSKRPPTASQRSFVTMTTNQPTRQVAGVRVTKTSQWRVLIQYAEPSKRSPIDGPSRTWHLLDTPRIAMTLLLQLLFENS